MNEKNENDTLGNETLRGLINNAGFVLDHPILLKIIESAPTAKIADDYIKYLGWSNDLARRVRAAVKLKQKFPQLWAEILKNDIKFSFFNWYYHNGIATYPVPQTEFLYGNRTSGNESIETKDWPYFLRELTFSNNNGKSQFDTFSSLSGHNNPTIKEVIAQDIYSIENPVDFNCCQHLIYQETLTDGSIKLFKSENDKCGQSLLAIKNNNLGSIQIRSQYLLVKAPNDWSPVIYKVVQLFMTAEQTPSDHTEYDVWTFFMRVDKYRKSIPDGQIIYKRVLNLWNEETERAATFGAKIKMEITGNICRILKAEDNPSLTIIPLESNPSDNFIKIQNQTFTKMNQYIINLYQLIERSKDSKNIILLTKLFGFSLSDTLDSKNTLFSLAKTNPTF